MPCTSRPRRSVKSTARLVAGAAALLAVATPVVQAAMFEPPGDQVLFGMWFDPAHGYSDRPALINERIDQNVAVFQIAQEIPLPAFDWVTGAGGPAPENTIELSRTDAAVFLTVYPGGGFDTVTTADFTQLGQQILDYQTTLNRTVFLRYAPEMQGLWNAYGQQPTAFIASWNECYTAVKAVAPDTIMVWAPNTPQGYPYGQTLTANSAADIALLDTNNNGELDADDDSLAPYYPGDDVVDWIGVSIYYKGTDSAQTENNVQPEGYCSRAINGINPSDGATITNWYANYCEAKPDKACMFAESGAAYHLNNTAATTVTRSQLQQGWISDCITNISMLDEFPRLRLIMHFEYEKIETANDNSNDLRDFRVTNDTAALAQLKADFASAGDRFSWAQSRAPPTSISSAGAPAATNSEGSTIVQAITATTRARPTTFPSLFGTTSDGTQRAEIIELGILIAAGIGGALAVMKTL